jgi:hypothetical protein
MNRIVLAVFIALGAAGGLGAQSYAFGIKGGLTIGTQQWEGFDQAPLFKYHGIAFIETADEDDNFALMAQLGYHLKGSSTRRRNVIGIGGNRAFTLPTEEFIFRNLSLSLAAKQKFASLSGDARLYYMFGIRGDYTLSTNLSEYREINMRFPVYPDDSEEVLRRWNYGAILGGGIELPVLDLVSTIIEFSINPDFSLQYQQPEINVNVNNEIYSGPLRIPQRSIRNLTFELTVGFRFLNRVEYID